jgi:hypothetical protein
MPNTIVLSIAVLAAFALFAGAVHLWIMRGDKKKAILMALAALVLLGNIAIIAAPR